VVPGAHFLETWADARAFDGTASLVQPLIRPLYGGRTIAEMLAALCGDPAPDARTLLRQQWVPEAAADAETQWHDWLSAGVIDGTAAEPIQVAVDASALAAVLSRVGRITASDGFSIAFRGDASVHDGSFTNNPWLQELPDPISKLTWGNAALISPPTAERLQVRDGQEIELRLAGRTLRLPVMRVPGHADDAATVPFGYGRAGAESIARGVGANAYRLWPSIEAYSAAGAGISPALDASGHARFAPLTTTQRHWELDGRPIVLHHTSTAFAADPGFTRDARGPVPTLYDYGREDGPQWGMSIDLSVCTGCSACVVACQAENNIPIVGRDEVAKGREMHWLRIDRYFAGPADRPRVFMQPMLCQQCEHAPCEYVCPVNATVHSPDGLNEMVYNRCVGTRFCSNNCPYKVRRFNWFNYTAQTPEVRTLVFNPEVTVRDRGVMEKCTFCVQRIRAAEIDVTVNGGAIPPDGVRTACQQACPTQAIVFGARNVRGWSLQQSLQSERRYDVLHELGTRPRVTYLARITNPNPALGEDA
jgi:molybdopterin-containing oxidoreductase family iron-sulfur binding subunit